MPKADAPSSPGPAIIVGDAPTTDVKPGWSAATHSHRADHGRADRIRRRRALLTASAPPHGASSGCTSAWRTPCPSAGCASTRRSRVLFRAARRFVHALEVADEALTGVLNDVQFFPAEAVGGIDDDAARSPRLMVTARTTAASRCRSASGVGQGRRAVRIARGAPGAICCAIRPTCSSTSCAMRPRRSMPSRIASSASTAPAGASSG